MIIGVFLTVMRKILTKILPVIYIATQLFEVSWTKAAGRALYVGKSSVDWFLDAIVLCLSTSNNQHLHVHVSMTCLTSRFLANFRRDFDLVVNEVTFIGASKTGDFGLLRCSCIAFFSFSNCTWLSGSKARHRYLPLFTAGFTRDLNSL